MCGALAYDPPRGAPSDYASQKWFDSHGPNAAVTAAGPEMAGSSADVVSSFSKRPFAAINVSNLDWMSQNEAQA